MVRINLCASWLILAALYHASPADAQVKSAYQLLPDTTQAVVLVPNTDELIGRWDRTQLAKLAADDAVKPFWEDQRQEIEKRFLDAGWRLNINPKDLSDIAEGQFSIAWIERASDARKPFGLALIVDIVEDRQSVDALLNRIDAELIARKAKKKSLSYEGEAINQYSLARPGELLIQETYYSIVDRQLLVSDDEQQIKDLIARIKDKPTATKTLDTEAAFLEGRKQLTSSADAQVEYFVRPIGFAKILKAIGGKRRGNADILAILANQGFSAIQCVCGEIQFGTDEFDIHHRGFTLADKPLPKSAAILDFPNKAQATIPNFVTDKVSSLLVGYWNSQEAFWKVEGLVDEMAGQEGVFMEVIKGIKTDPTGPKIDIKQEVLPYFTNDIYSISETVSPITTDSLRNLIALRVTQPEKLKAVLRQAMKNEPDTERVEGPDEIWKKINSADNGAESPDLGNDFGDFGAPGNAPPAGAPAPWLSSWAIAVHGDYFMFASHVDMIKDAISQANSGQDSPLTREPSSTRMRTALSKVFGDEPNCFWQIIRTDLSYRMQYELFRSGELDQSESWLASLLDRLLQNSAEIKANGVKKIDGKRLPKFEDIAHYLQPSGMVVQTKDNGWSFGSLLLASPNLTPNPNPKADTELPGTPRSRLSNTDAGEKR